MSCGKQVSVQIGNKGMIPLSIRTRRDGPAVDADSVPTITAIRKAAAGGDPAGIDETDATLAATIIQAQDDTPAAITGEYELQFDSAACEEGDTLTFYISAVVNGVTVKTTAQAYIEDKPEARPVIC